jgi:hypothetical protein
MSTRGGDRASRRQSSAASLVLVVALVAYVGYSALRLRRAVTSTTLVPPAGAPPAPSAAGRAE